jgi:hypothetical protein
VTAIVTGEIITEERNEVMIDGSITAGSEKGSQEAEEGQEEIMPRQ